MAIIVDLFVWVFAHLFLKAHKKYVIEDERKRMGIMEREFIIFDHTETYGNLNDLGADADDSSCSGGNGDYYDSGEW